MVEAGGPLPVALREDIIALSRAAAVSILDIYAGDFDVEHKADASPVTAADLAAHRVIVDGLRALTPEIPVLSEEAAHVVAADVRRQWSRMWLVDPIDGTREFVKRNGEFSVNIALIENGVAVYGVIQAPVSGVVWHGGPGLGAWRRDADTDLPLRTHPVGVDGPLRVADRRTHRDPRVDVLLARLAQPEPVMLGSSLKFCWLAEGRLDVYPRFGPTSEWDTGAGQAILEGAGGVVLDLHGRPFRYNCRDTVLNGDFIALGDPNLPWRDWI